MPRRILWTPEMDAAILRMRDVERRSWDDIAVAVGVTRWTVIERGNKLGAAREMPPVERAPEPSYGDREPFPPGHPLTWGTIIAGTCLAGAQYPHPVFA